MEIGMYMSANKVVKVVRDMCIDALDFADALMHGRPVPKSSNEDAICIYDATSFDDFRVAADFIIGFWVGDECKKDCLRIRVRYDSVQSPGMTISHSIDVYRVDKLVPAYRDRSIIPVAAMQMCSGIKVDIMEANATTQPSARDNVHILCAYIMDPVLRMQIRTSKCAALCAGRVFKYPHGGAPHLRNTPEPVIVMPDLQEIIAHRFRYPADIHRAKMRNDAIFKELMEVCWHPERLFKLSPAVCELDSLGTGPAAAAALDEAVGGDLE